MTILPVKQSLLDKLAIDFENTSIYKLAHYSAAEYHLALIDGLPVDASDCEKVENGVEALYNLHAVEDIERIKQVLVAIPILVNHLDRIPGLAESLNS